MEGLIGGLVDYLYVDEKFQLEQQTQINYYYDPVKFGQSAEHQKRAEYKPTSDSNKPLYVKMLGKFVYFAGMKITAKKGDVHTNTSPKKAKVEPTIINRPYSPDKKFVESKNETIISHGNYS